jgi:hypothetical protein
MAGKSIAERDRVGFHVSQIEDALGKAQEARFGVIAAINDAYEELGDDVFQKELAKRLGISAPQLTKYIKIAKCSPLIVRADKLPETFTTLYDLTRLRTEYVKAYGEQSGDKRFENYLEKHVDPTTEARKIADAIARVKSVSSRAKKEKREEDLLTLGENKLPSSATEMVAMSFRQLIERRDVFRTLFIAFEEKDLRWAAQPDVFVSQIEERFPIAKLRAPSVKETVAGFVLCPARLIDGGLKLLEAAGFEFRDFFSPSLGASGFELLRDHEVMLRGERGAPRKFRQDDSVDAGVEGALAIAESLGAEPRLLISSTERRQGWTCLDPNLK